MEDAAGKNKFNLGFEGMEWLVIQDLKSVLQSTKCSLYCYPKGRVSEVENLSLVPWPVIPKLSKVVPCTTVRWKKAWSNSISSINKVEFA